MKCKLCIEQEDWWKVNNPLGSQPKCAFETGEFSKDNWCCGTLSKLREYGRANNGKYGNFYYRDDIEKGTINVVGIPESDELPGYYIVLGYYKERGKVDQCHLIGRKGNLTLEMAEKMLL